MTTVAVVYNPTSGAWRGYPNAAKPNGHDALIRNWFCEAGLEEISIRRTRCAGDGAEQARAAVLEGYDVVATVGGDGTVREVIEGLYHADSGTLAVIPLGTANVLARALHIPLFSPAAAAAIISSGKPRQLDLGVCGEHVFVLHAGIGLDGAVVKDVDPRLKRRIGKSAYLLSALTKASRMGSHRVVIVPDGNEGAAMEVGAYQLFVANVAEYGGNMRLCDYVDPSDGILDLVICRRRLFTLASALYDGMALITGRLSASSGVEVHQVRCVQIRSREGGELPVQLDGDAFGTTPVEIRIAPGALRVLAA
jgi:diacylglycerol kinase (ATP)